MKTFRSMVKGRCRFSIIPPPHVIALYWMNLCIQNPLIELPDNCFLKMFPHFVFSTFGSCAGLKLQIPKTI